MGSSNQKGKKFQDTSKYGDIYFKIDKTSYYAGDTVSGSIYINLRQSYPGNKLFLKFKGKETVHIALEDESKDDGIYHMYSDSRNLLKFNMPVYSWETLIPGQYVIPFAFSLPFELAPSFYQQGNCYAGLIEYKMEAFIQPFNEKDPKLKYKEKMTIRESVKNAQEKKQSEITTKLECCCCCPKGSNHLKVNFEKNYYSSGETANVAIELNNSQSNLSNEKIVFALKQNLRLTAKNKTYWTTLPIVKDKLPGVKAHTLSNAGSLKITLPENGVNGPLIDMKNPKKFELMNLPQETKFLSSSTQGSLITSHYFLEVSCPMGGCCTLAPKIECPIEIYYPESKYPDLNAPHGWSPETLPVVNIAFPFTMQQPNMNPAMGNKMGMIGGNMDPQYGGNISKNYV